MVKKDYSISCIRLISTLAIVTLHITQQLEYRVNSNFKYASEWLNLGLVMFFTISAFLYSNRYIERKKIKKWITKRYLELTVPGALVAILVLLTFGIAKKVSLTRIIGSLGAGLGLEVFMSDSWMFAQLWFLTYILFCYITVPLIQKIDVKKIPTAVFWILIPIITVVFQASGMFLEKLGLITLSWGILLRFYLPYFIFKKYPINSEKCKKVMSILTVFSFLCIALTCYVRYFCEFEGILAALAETIFIYTQTLAGTVLFYWLYNIFNNRKLNEKLLSFTDKYSYPVYLTHCLFIGYSTSRLIHSCNIVLGIVEALLLTAVSSLAVYFISTKIKKAIYSKIKL